MKRSALPAALLTVAIAAAPLAALADTSRGHGYYGNGADANGGYYHGGYASEHAFGTIAETRGTMLRLDNGRPVYLHRGTVINPTGITLRPGMRISVTGSPGGDGGIRADVIDVGRRYDGGRNGDGDRP